jgi:hypothetical protein
MKKFFAKLINWQAQRNNSAEMIHGSDQKDQAKLERDLAKERHEQIMDGRGDKRYVSERTDPGEAVLGPSESKPEEA